MDRKTKVVAGLIGANVGMLLYHQWAIKRTLNLMDRLSNVVLCKIIDDEFVKIINTNFN